MLVHDFYPQNNCTTLNFVNIAVKRFHSNIGREEGIVIGLELWKKTIVYLYRWQICFPLAQIKFEVFI